MSLLLPFFTVLILLIYNIRKKKSYILVSNIIFATYLISFSGSYYLGFLGIYSIPPLKSMLIFSLSILVFLMPFVIIPEKSYRQLILIRHPLYALGVFLTAIFTFLSFLYFAPNFVHAFTETDLKYARNMVNQGQGELVEAGYIAGLFNHLAQIYILPLFFFFMEAIYRKRFTLLSSVMIVGSLAIILFVMSRFGRDGIIRWGGPFLFLFIILKDFLVYHVRRKILFVFATFSGAFLFFSILVTIARFRDRAYSTFIFVINYLGQSPFNYAQSLDVMKHEPLNYGRYNLPLFFNGFNRSKSHLDASLVSENFIAAHASVGYRTNVFGTFLRELLADFGCFGSFVVGFIIVFVFLHISREIKRHKRLLPSSLLIIVLYGTFLFQGVFYNIWKGVLGNGMILIVAIVWGFLKWAERRYSVNILEK